MNQLSMGIPLDNCVDNIRCEHVVQVSNLLWINWLTFERKKKKPLGRKVKLTSDYYEVELIATDDENKSVEVVFWIT